MTPRAGSPSSRKQDASTPCSWVMKLFRSGIARPLAKLHAWKTQHQYLGRYSVEKLCALHHYQTTVSNWRVAFVIFITPVPAFLVLLALDVVPMNDPREGPGRNAICFIRSVVAHAVLPFMILMSTKQALQLSDRQYALRHIFRIGLCVSLATEVVCIPAAFIWRFPVPFREVTAIPWFGGSVLFFNWYFAWDEFKRKFAKLKQYFPMIIMQLSMYYGFLSLAVAFTYISSTTQIVLVLLFPGVKILVKHIVWTKARQLDDLSTDVTICFVELTGALYQTVCLQFAKSQALQIVILVSDFAQALYEVQAYMFHEYIIDGPTTVQTAVKIVLGGVLPGVDERPLAASPSKSKSVETSGIWRYIPRPWLLSSPANPDSMATLGASALANVKGYSGSVFLKPRMIKATNTKRLLDLNQYKYEIDLPLDDITTDASETTRAAKEAKQFKNEGVASPKGEKRFQRHSTASHSMGSPRSSPSSAPSQYERHSKLPSDTSSYGVAGADRASLSLISTAVSPPQIAASPSQPKLLPPLGRASSHLASLSQIGIRYEPASQPTLAAFSVYDPQKAVSPTLARSSSLLAPLMNTGSPGSSGSEQSHPPLTSRKSLPLSRKSKRDSAVHPGGFGMAALADLRAEVESQSTPQSQSQAEVGHKPATPPLTAEKDPAMKNQAPGHLAATAIRAPGRRSSLEPAKSRGEAVGRMTRVMIDGIQVARKDQARVLEQTLQLLFSCEVLIFVEFMEVLLPTLYGMVIGVLWHLHNARYNLLFISMSHFEMLSAVGSSLLYALLESMSLIVMAVLLKRRYGISALHLLAFILEKYWKVLYGKMIGSFIVVWVTLTVHQGVDFTFTYDYGEILRRFGTSRFS